MNIALAQVSWIAGKVTAIRFFSELVPFGNDSGKKKNLSDSKMMLEEDMEGVN